MNSLTPLGSRRFACLLKWRNLRVSVSLLQNGSALSNSISSAAVSTADISPKNGGKRKNFETSSFVDSLSFVTKLTSAVSSTAKVNLDSVPSLFRSYGFTDSQISIIVRTYPRLLSAKSLGSKLQYLQSRGASSSELTEIVSTAPKILGKRGDKTISLYYDLVKEILEADKSSSSCLSWSNGNKEDNKIRNLFVLRELGVPQKSLIHLLISKGQPVCGKERFEEILKKVVDMGFDPTTSKFVDALRMLYQVSNKTIEEKIQVYKGVGLTVEDVWTMFKKWPFSLKYSEKKVANCIETFKGLGFNRDECVMMFKSFPPCIGYSAVSVKKKTKFLVEKMNWPIKDVALVPQVFGYSLEKRTVPRCNVIKVLMLKGLLKTEVPPMASVLSSTSQVFLNLYVRKHDDMELVAELMAVLTGDRVSLTDQKTHLERIDQC